ncbi:MAG TPA: hypothetical protein VIL97_10325, partial [Thermoanaerobaculia bacterium]
MPRICAVLFALLVSFPALAQKSLHWKALEVEARLDAEGRLHVRERHAMVFTGDWNGGERVFEPGRDGRLDFNSITREGVGPLKRGKLDRVDHYDFLDKTTLRWRSRYQSDPPFDNTEIAYVLDYSLENILLTKGDEYLLDHDFAFPNRSGDIERFTLRLELDPVWRPAVRVDTPITRERGPLRPGESVDVDLPLTFHGSSAPSGVRTSAPMPLRLASLGGLFAAAAFFFARFYREQKERGRFAPLTPISQIDEAWLQDHVFSMKPEVVGAAWDESTGAAEVAALIARMTQEKKLATRVRPASGFFANDVLELELKVDRGTLTGYEKKLVQALFGSSDQTDTETIKKRYSSHGFDPSSHIDDGVDQSLERLHVWRDQPGESRKRGTLLSILASLALLAFAAVGSQTDFLAVVTTFFGSTVACLAAAAVAAITSRSVMHARGAVGGTLVPLAAIGIAPYKWLTNS